MYIIRRGEPSHMHGISCTPGFLLIRGEPERALNTRGTGSGFICINIMT